MTKNEVALMMLKGAIVDMKQEDQDKIYAIAGQFKDIMDDSRDNDEEAFAQLAISLVGIETAVSMGA